MRVAAIAIMLAGGCDTVFSLDKVPDAPTYSCVGTGLGQIDPFCPAAGEIPAADLSSLTLDTTDCPITRTQADGTELCVHFVEQLELGAALRATGPRPLVLAAIDSILVNASGVVDVSSKRGSAGGAGANGGCDTTNIDGLDGSTSVGAGGGAGGSFVSKGGNGATGASGKLGGVAAPVVTPMVVRGGCPGGRGGAGLTAATSSAAGGGAIYLMAGTSITLEGIIAAYGAGGDGASGAWQGGAGGGAGGFIAFDAPTVVVGASARLLAGGGGGGEGGGSGSLSGNPGENGDTGVGGNGITSGGNGGNGSGGSGGNGLTGAIGFAGGGGGGGGGFVGIYAQNRTIEPGATSVPPLP